MRRWRGASAPKPAISTGCGARPPVIIDPHEAPNPKLPVQERLPVAGPGAAESESSKVEGCVRRRGAPVGTWSASRSTTARKTRETDTGHVGQAASVRGQPRRDDVAFLLRDGEGPRLAAIHRQKVDTAGTRRSRPCLLRRAIADRRQPTAVGRPGRLRWRRGNRSASVPTPRRARSGRSFPFRAETNECDLLPVGGPGRQAIAAVVRRRISDDPTSLT